MFTQAYILGKILKIICEIMHATGKYSQGLMGPTISAESFKSTKIIILPHLPDCGKFENNCFVSVAWMVRMSHALIYNEVDINKITTISRKTAFIDEYTINLRVNSTSVRKKMGIFSICTGCNKKHWNK